VLGFFGEHRPIAEFFGEPGKLLLMFSARLEIDIALFRRARARSIIFGLLTTNVPLLFGTLEGLGFWLCAHSGDRRRIAARIPHVAE
jgi:Kef-type K+ transport system membrane component KefB